MQDWINAYTIGVYGVGTVKLLYLGVIHLSLDREGDKKKIMTWPLKRIL